MDSGLAATIATGGMGILTLIIHKIKCLYTREDGECMPRCACMDKPLLDESEIEVHTVTVNDVDLLYVAKK